MMLKTVNLSQSDRKYIVDFVIKIIGKEDLLTIIFILGLGVDEFDNSRLTTLTISVLNHLEKRNRILEFLFALRGARLTNPETNKIEQMIYDYYSPNHINSYVRALDPTDPNWEFPIQDPRKNKIDEKILSLINDLNPSQMDEIARYILSPGQFDGYIARKPSQNSDFQFYDSERREKVVITMPGRLLGWGRSKWYEFRKHIASGLEVDPQVIDLTHVRDGSIKLLLSMPASVRRRLITQFRNKQLSINWTLTSIELFEELSKEEQILWFMNWKKVFISRRRNSMTSRLNNTLFLVSIVFVFFVFFNQVDVVAFVKSQFDFSSGAVVEIIRINLGNGIKILINDLPSKTYIDTKLILISLGLFLSQFAVIFVLRGFQNLSWFLWKFRALNKEIYKKT